MYNEHLFFLTDQYYIDFPDNMLMKNKDDLSNHKNGRPCFFAFPDAQIPDILWVVPISSKTDKYRRIEQEKIKRYGQCNTIRFGTVLGRDTAFLIQNMCPVTNRYLIPYLDNKNRPIRIDSRVADDVVRNARKVLALEKRGVKVIFPDVFSIYDFLRSHIDNTHEMA